MYESFFALNTKPFDLLPNPDFLFPSRSHRRAIAYLDYAVRERMGFILLTGEIGSGKTTIVRDLIKKHREGVVLSKVFSTNVTFRELMCMINQDFGLPAAGDKVELLRELNEFLIDQFTMGNRAILIIDEAQNLTPEALEEIRMLSNLETDHSKLLQIILVGQPELRRTLALPELLQLRQRISFYCHIRPLQPEEVEQYILHRLEVAGNRTALSLAPEVITMIWQYSRGIPRLINIICEFLLLSAFSEECRAITADFAREIIGELDFDRQFWGGIPDDGEENRDSNGCFQQFLSDIASRVEALEKTGPQNGGVSGEIMERMDRADQTFEEYRNRMTEDFCQLKRDVETLRHSAPLESSPDGPAPVKKGILRYLFRVQ